MFVTTWNAKRFKLFPIHSKTFPLHSIFVLVYNEILLPFEHIIRSSSVKQRENYNHLVEIEKRFNTNSSYLSSVRVSQDLEVSYWNDCLNS